MSGTISCVCGYTSRHIGPESSAPKSCPKCVAGRELPGFNRKMRRQLARAVRHVDRVDAQPLPPGDDAA